MSDHKDIDDVSGIETTGHSWDGIKELNNPLPRWWLWTFYASIAFAAVYTVLYPAWPLVNSATTGLLGWSSRADLRTEMPPDSPSRNTRGKPRVVSNLEHGGSGATPTGPLRPR